MKTPAEWKAMEQELMDLKQKREELKNSLNATSKRIHILSTSIAQYNKKNSEGGI